jgi:hypothetical protein
MYDDMEIEVDDDNDELDPNEIGNIVSEIHPCNSKQHEENHDDGQDDEEYPTNETDDASNESVSSQDDEDNDQATQTYKTTWSGRVSKPPVKLSFSQYNIPTQGYQYIEYTYNSAKAFAVSLNHMMDDSKQYFQFVQTYSLNKGIQRFGKKGWDAAFGEMKQLNDREVFEPIDVSKLSAKEKRQALESLIFLVEKKDNTIKGRTCANDSVQREFVSREDATSPTAATESIFLTATLRLKKEGI